MAAREPSTILIIDGALARRDLPELYERACALLGRSGAGLLCCEVRGVQADAVAVDALARLELAARRHGCKVKLLGPSEELRRLVAFMGLEDVLAG